MPSVASEMSAFVRRPDHHGLRNAAPHADEHAAPFSTLLDERPEPEPEPEPSARSGPTRVEPADRPADSAEAAPAADAPSEITPETQIADGGKQPAGDTVDAAAGAAQATPGEAIGIVETPGLPAESGDDADADAALVATQAPVPDTQPVPQAAVAQPAVPVVTAVVPVEGGEPIAPLDAAVKPAAPQIEAKAPAGTTAPADPAALPAGDAVDTEAAATAPLIKAAGGQPAEEKKQAQPSDIETVTLAPEQQTKDAKKPDAPQPAKPEAAARPQAAADPLQQDILKLSGDDLDVKAHGEQTQTATLTATHAQTAQGAAGSHSAAQTQQQTPLVPVAGLAVEIAAQARAGKNRFEIRLDPPELGRIDVRLDVDREGNVTSRLVVERAETLDLLRRDAHSLERALNQAGLKTSDNALEFSLRDQNADRQQGENEQRAGERLTVVEDDHAGAQPVRGYGRLLGLGGGLDIRV